MLAQRVSRLWFVSVVAAFVLLGVPGTASAAPPTCDEPARVLYQLPAGLTWTHPRADCTDPDGDPINIEISEPPEFGTFDPPGAIPINQIRTYTANADAAGNRDSMKFRAVTPNGEASPDFQVDVWILPAHSAPTCKDLTLDVKAGASVAIAPVCVDADGDDYALRVTKAPAHGTYDPVRGVYTAAPRYAGKDTMTFVAVDEWRLVSAARTVTLNVKSAPGAPPLVRDKTAPTLTLRARKKSSLRRGIRLTATASEAGRMALEVTVGRKTAQRAEIDTRVGSLVRNLAAGKTNFKLKLYRKARRELADLRRVRVKIVARLVDAAGNVRTKRLRITLK